MDPRCNSDHPNGPFTWHKIVLAQSKVCPRCHDPSSARERAWTLETFWAPNIATSTSTSTSSKFVFQIPSLDGVATRMNSSSSLQTWVKFGLKLQSQIAEGKSKRPNSQFFLYVQNFIPQFVSRFFASSSSPIISEVDFKVQEVKTIMGFQCTSRWTCQACLFLSLLFHLWYLALHV